MSGPDMKDGQDISLLIKSAVFVHHWVDSVPFFLPVSPCSHSVGLC